MRVIAKNLALLGGLALGFVGATAATGCDPGFDPHDLPRPGNGDGPGDADDCDPDLICGQALTCVDGLLYPTTCGPDNCDQPLGPCDDDDKPDDDKPDDDKPDGDKKCDPDLICGQALTCVDGHLYPTTCGPANCDQPLGPCDDDDKPDDKKCDPDLICGQALTCVDGKLYPTTCGPANCDEPLGPCDDDDKPDDDKPDDDKPDDDKPDDDKPDDDKPDDDPDCDPELLCAQVLTCVDGMLYPTACGPLNCDDPIGPCEPELCDPDILCIDTPTCVDGMLYPTLCGAANCDEPIGPCEDKEGSCKGACGEYAADAPCQCDPLCVDFGDCCGDFEEYCV